MSKSKVSILSMGLLCSSALFASFVLASEGGTGPGSTTNTSPAATATETGEPTETPPAVSGTGAPTETPPAATATETGEPTGTSPTGTGPRDPAAAPPVDTGPGSTTETQPAVSGTGAPTETPPAATGTGTGVPAATSPLISGYGNRAAAPPAPGSIFMPTREENQVISKNIISRQQARKFREYNGSENFIDGMVLSSPGIRKLLSTDSIIYSGVETGDPVLDELNKSNFYAEEFSEMKASEQDNLKLIMLNIILSNLDKRKSYLDNIISKISDVIHENQLEDLKDTLNSYGLRFDLKKMPSNGEKLKPSDLKLSKYQFKEGAKVNGQPIIKDMLPTNWYFLPPTDIQERLSSLNIEISPEIRKERISLGKDIDKLHDVLEKYHQIPKDIAQKSDDSDTIKSKLESINDRKLFIKSLYDLIEDASDVENESRDENDFSALRKDLDGTKDYLTAAEISANFLRTAKSKLGSSRRPQALRESRMSEVSSPESVLSELRKYLVATNEEKEVIYDSSEGVLKSRIATKPVSETDSRPELNIRDKPEKVEPNQDFVFNIADGRLYILPHGTVEDFHHHQIYVTPSGSPMTGIDVAGILKFNDKGKISHISSDTGHFKSSAVYHLYPVVKALPREWFADDAKVSNIISKEAAMQYREMPYEQFIKGGGEDLEYWRLAPLTEEQLKEYHAFPKEKLGAPPKEETKAEPQSSETKAEPQSSETKAEPQSSETKAEPQSSETKAEPQSSQSEEEGM